MPQSPQLLASNCKFTQAPSQQLLPAEQQRVPWLPVQNVSSQGQTLQPLLQQNWPATQQTPLQQVGFVESQQSCPCVPVQGLLPAGQLSAPLTQTSPRQTSVALLQQAVGVGLKGPVHAE